jgi:predicted PurR-regulated permease PerM
MPVLETKRERAAVLIAALGIGILLALAPFTSGLLGAAVLYVLCIGPYRRLVRLLRRPTLAALLVLLSAVVVIALPLVWLVGLVIDQAPDTLRSVQSSPLFARIAQLRVGRFEVGAEIAKASGTMIQWVSAQAFDVVGSAARATLNLVIAFFGLYYMLHAGQQMWDAMRGYIPFTSATAEKLRERFYGVTQATLLGTALTAAMQGALVGLAFLITGLPNPLFWGTITAFVSILPVLGSGIVWMPATLVLLAENRIGAAIVMLVIGWLIGSNIDNLIRPMVYRRVSNIHPMVTLVGAFAGVKYFGLPGLLLGPLAIAYFFELLFFYREEYGPPQENDRSPPAAAMSSGAVR